eukprot:gene17685-20396_t
MSSNSSPKKLEKSYPVEECKAMGRESGEKVVGDTEQRLSAAAATSVSCYGLTGASGTLWAGTYSTNSADMTATTFDVAFAFLVAYCAREPGLPISRRNFRVEVSVKLTKMQYFLTIFFLVL